MKKYLKFLTIGTVSILTMPLLTSLSCSSPKQELENNQKIKFYLTRTQNNEDKHHVFEQQVKNDLPSNYHNLIKWDQELNHTLAKTEIEKMILNDFIAIGSDGKVIIPQLEWIDNYPTSKEITFADAGTYQIKLIATDQEGNQGTHLVNLILSPEPKMYIAINPIIIVTDPAIGKSFFLYVNQINNQKASTILAKNTIVNEDRLKSLFKGTKIVIDPESKAVSYQEIPLSFTWDKAYNPQQVGTYQLSAKATVDDLTVTYDLIVYIVDL